MGIKFKVHETPQPKNRPGKKLSHARAVSDGTAKMDYLCKMICSRSTISSADVKAVLDSFAWAITLCLKSGQHVELEELGYFSPSLRTQPSADGKKMTVMVDGVNFRCSEKLKEGLRNAELEHVKTSAKLTLDERKKKMQDFLQRNKRISTLDYAELNGCSRYRATADIKLFVEKGVLSKIGGGTHVMYVLPINNE